uniref:C2H2-type domain-containing protein n=1 Tax=Oryzias melastigma TaxID=30732 RepID=A0A3B3C853_ORYME
MARTSTRITVTKRHPPDSDMMQSLIKDMTSVQVSPSCMETGLLDTGFLKKYKIAPSCVCVPAVLPQYCVSERVDLCNLQRNPGVEQKEQEPPPIKDEQEEQELLQIEEEWGEPALIQMKEEQEGLPPQMKEEQEWLCINHDEEQLDLKQETGHLMETPNYEENEHNTADLNNQLSFNVSNSQDEESTSTTAGETDPENRDESTGRYRSADQCVNSSHMSDSQRDSAVGKKPKKETLDKTCKQPPNKKRLSYIKSGKMSRIVRNLSAYMRTEPGERPYVCKECDKSFSWSSQFRLHMRTHTGEKPFSCKECDTCFSQIGTQKRHMRTHTGEKSFSCNECDTSFSQRFDLKRHMDIHTGEKPFSCKECDISFSRTSSLKSHMRTHTGEKPFSCKECDTSFNRIYNLKIHMRTHTGEKPFSCKECDTSFSQKSSLKKHMRTHTGERPFSCEQCKKCFTCVSNLNAHLRTHTGEKPFSCKECDKSFSQRFHLKKHIKTHTGENLHINDLTVSQSESVEINQF